ncbi:hypothetical protein DRQ50_03295 [bacterium]|nr:MAG: hypothetical protein DRQ50_03295 [bacterium]
MSFGSMVSISVLTALAAVVIPVPEAGADPGEKPVQFLFIHHSCGGQLLAAPGPNDGGHADTGDRCIYVSHPNGGGLRADLEAAGLAVNEASYGSIVGEDTDICHWHAKFRDGMDRIVRTRRQDELLPEGLTNQVVAFKSCFPNNDFTGEGTEPGDPDSCELTVANAKAAYRALLPSLAARPEVLFVAFTAPPMAEPKPVGLKQKIKALFSGRPRQAEWARAFNAWLVDAQNGWLADHGPGNIVVFDHYDILTGHGETDWSAYPSRDGRDSHPNGEGNREAARAFVPFIEQALTRFADKAGQS